MAGWISLHRKLCENDIWTCEPFTRGQAWVDLLLLANHKDGYIYVREHKIELKRGDVGWSQNRLSERWKWSRKKVANFLNMLEKEQQIIQLKSHSYTVIRLINYNEYQDREQQENNRSTTEAQQKHTNNNVNNDNNVNKSVEDEKYLDELPSQDRDTTIRQYLSTSTLTPNQINIYMKRLASNSYCKVISGNRHRIKLTEVRADAEYLQAMGWLDTKENANTQTISLYD